MNRRWSTIALLVALAGCVERQTTGPRPGEIAADNRPASSAGPTTAPSSSTSSASSTPSTSASTTTTPTSTTIQGPLPAPRSVLLMGDSVAYDLAPAFVAALSSTGVEVRSSAAVGGGLLDTTGPSFEYFTNELERWQPDMVIYQLSVWDYGTLDDQRRAYRRFTDAVLASGASLVYVTAPPLSPLQPVGSLAQLPAIIAAEAVAYPTLVRVLDASALWGDDFTTDLGGDGWIDRKLDGVHVCPPGAARFANWLVAELAATAQLPVPPDDLWMLSGWIEDDRYSVELCPLPQQGGGDTTTSLAAPTGVSTTAVG